MQKLKTEYILKPLFLL